MVNKKLFLLGAVLVAVLVGVGAGLLVIRSSQDNLSSPSRNQEQQTMAKSVAPPTGKLEVIKKNLSPSSLDFDIVYLDTSPAEIVAGFSLHMLVSPTVGNPGSSTVEPGPGFVKGSFIAPLKSVKNSSASTEITLAIAVAQPGTKVTLKNGDVLASIHLAGVKKGSYKVAFDTTQSKVLTGVNSENIIGMLSDTTLTVD